MLDVTQAIVGGADWFVTKPVLAKSMAWQVAALALMGALAVATFIVALVQGRRIGSSHPFWICVGAALATFYEPLGDLFAHVTYHEEGQLSFTSAFGFRTPLWIVPTYVAFFGATTLWVLSVIARGITVRRWMLLFIATLPGAWLFEVPLLRMGAIEYYGANQPLRILGYPLWMAFANSATMFVVAAACHWLKSTPLFMRHPVLFALIFPMLVMGANSGTALPLGSAINATSSTDITNAAGIASAALGLMYVWICGQLLTQHSGRVASGRPVDLKEK